MRSRRRVARTSASATYRKSIELAPQLGEAYWSLANLKTFRFSSRGHRMRCARSSRAPTCSDEDRFHFHFALGKALEDAGDYAESFEHYEQGNRLRRAGVDYDADGTREQVQRTKALFTPEFFARARGLRVRRRPIRSSSSACRARGRRCSSRSCRAIRWSKARWSCRTSSRMARELGRRRRRARRPSTYPRDRSRRSTREQLRALGERYLGADAHPSQDAMRRSSSTRCRTTSRTSA